MKSKSRQRERLVILSIAVLMFLTGCSEDFMNSNKVLENFIVAVAAGDAEKVEKFYAPDNEEEEAQVQEEIDSKIAYFKAHSVKEVQVRSVGVIENFTEYSYLYVVYDLLSESDKTYPCADTYFMEKEEEKYYIMPAAQVSEAMAAQATEAYKVFRKSEPYKTYEKEYQVFMNQNPDYEQKINEKMNV
ncbi:MAG: hypothetical protein ACK5MN_11995 [Lachnospiraceae bacterium]